MYGSQLACRTWRKILSCWACQRRFNYDVALFNQEEKTNTSEEN